MKQNLSVDMKQFVEILWAQFSLEAELSVYTNFA